MIEKSILESCPFPCVLFGSHSGEEILLNRGSLFPAASDLLDRERVELYSQADSGWSVCPSGYAVYKKDLDSSLRHSLVLFGLKVHGVSTVSGKSDQLSVKLSRENVEEYVKEVERALGENEKALRRMVSSNLHEIRAINANVYNTALNLRQELEDDRFDSASFLYGVKNIVSLSEIISLRSKYLDVISNVPTSVFKSTILCPYKKLDKVVKSLIPTASSTKVNLKISGVSRSTIKGINQFDLLPYIVISNAIKYSPRNSEITVIIKEEKRNVLIEVMSKGPLVEEAEYGKIFEYGYRGKHARRMFTDGDGVGLFFANKIISECSNAYIQFKQKKGVSQNIGGINYYTSVVRIGFEIYEQQKLSFTDRALSASRG